MDKRDTLPDDKAETYILSMTTFSKVVVVIVFLGLFFGVSSFVKAATLLTPQVGDSVADGTANFTWQQDGNEYNWRLEIGTTPGATDLFASHSVDQGAYFFSQTVTGLPVDGTVLYVTLWGQDNNIWSSAPLSFATFDSTSGGTTGGDTGGGTDTGSTIAAVVELSTEDRELLQTSIDSSEQNNYALISGLIVLSTFLGAAVGATR